MAELVVWDNTFQLIADANILAGERLDVDSWTDADTNQKTIGLIQAYRHLVRLPYYAPEVVEASTGVWSTAPFYLTALTETERARLPTALLEDICMAQLLYADELIDGYDAYVNRRRDLGVTSEKIGELSTGFASGSSNRAGGGLSTRVLGYAGGWAVVNPTIYVTRV